MRNFCCSKTHLAGAHESVYKKWSLLSAKSGLCSLQKSTISGPTTLSLITTFTVSFFSMTVGLTGGGVLLNQNIRPMMKLLDKNCTVYLCCIPVLYCIPLPLTLKFAMISNVYSVYIIVYSYSVMLYHS